MAANLPVPAIHCRCTPAAAGEMDLPIRQERNHGPVRLPLTLLRAAELLLCVSDDAAVEDGATTRYWTGSNGGAW